ncbi:MAG: polyphosphate:AMP phosphotransferase [Burkholderiaceae bacterium]
MSEIIHPSPDVDQALDGAETDPSLPKEQARERIAVLRTNLLKAQYAALKKADSALLIVVAGIDGVGKGGCIRLLNEWMDARHVSTLAFGPPGPQVAQMPALWRYWAAMPAKGQTGIVFGSWYHELFAELAEKKPDWGRVDHLAQRIREFEDLLTHNHVKVLKLWFHMSREGQAGRVQALLSNPDTAWQVAPMDLKVSKRFDRARRAGAVALTLTHAAHAPWVVIPSADDSLRSVHAGDAVLKALRSRPRPNRLPRTAVTPAVQPLRLDTLDYAAGMSKSDYEPLLAQWQGRLARAVRHKKFASKALILAFEGQDAAGKGGAIRRVTHALDPRQFRAIPISAPTDEELARPYLWRFWRHLPEPGRIAIFDRSWYGRVLVERVEGYASQAQWRRAYREINEFETQLIENGAIVLKFWLAITKEEQLQRFHDRQKSPFKTFKITPDDWRNRKQWDAYVDAANDMFAYTHTAMSPWHLVSANDKHHARIEVLKQIVLRLEAAINT